MLGGCNFQVLRAGIQKSAVSPARLGSSLRQGVKTLEFPTRGFP